LQLLTLHKKTISFAACSYLLMSPFLAGAEYEQVARANFERMLRQKNVNQINLQDEVWQYCPVLTKHIKQALLFIEQQPKTLLHSEWAQVFNTFLSLLGWPGERSLNSEEYQIMQSWLALLADLTTVDYVATDNKITLQQAL